jgi:hypothetical protein
MLKSIWTYGIQLWGTASTSNIEILEHFQLTRLGTCRIRLSEGISKHQQHQQLKKKSNDIALNTGTPHTPKRPSSEPHGATRHLPNDLPTRFLVQLPYLLKKKSNATALNTELASVHTQMT